MNMIIDPSVSSSDHGLDGLTVCIFFVFFLLFNFIICRISGKVLIYNTTSKNWLDIRK
jgi:hypothetical protein